MKNKMRVLVLTTKPPWPEHDGGAIASSRIISGLSFNGAEVHLLSLTTPKHPATGTPETATKNNLRSYSECFVDTTIRKLQLIKNLFLSNTPYDLQRFYSDDAMERIRELCLSVPFDIIQCEGLVFSLYVSGIRHSTGARVILRAHNLEHRIRRMMARREKNIFKKLYLLNLSGRIKRVESSCLRLFDAIVAISEPDAEWFMGLEGKAPVFTSPTGIGITGNQYKTKTSENNVGFIGSLDWSPNIDGLIWFIKEVWPSVVNAVPQACLHIAGRNADRDTQRKLSGMNIEYHGEVYDANAFMISMKVMIAPLFSGSGMRIKIIESMGAGVPVVASPVAVKGLPFENGKDIVIAPSEETFSRGVIELLKNDLMANKTASEAFNTLKADFDNNSITSKLICFYKTLV
jgi:polysaccharide biosynthesis protein PslH